MPTVKELESLANFGRSNPAIDTGYFPNAVAVISHVWSGSPYADYSDYSDYAWYVSFASGLSNVGYRNYSLAVRLVRDGQ
ncbi:MAG: DUF1566 domain-containing protein [Candidatus Electrothrix sp. AUS4]|nr:DUF1566 domain-containing protein [Candidatus Electrothrix sp. AUS4]